ncbi:MAG: hypothetical protein ACPGGA_11260, partial [Balneolaceae bacterium]
MIRLFLILLILVMCSFSANAQDEISEVIYSELDNATSIYATQDHLFVVESGKHRLLKLDHDGNLLETLGGLGSGDYQLDTPMDVDATNGLKIYISDYGNNRIQIFDRRFQFLGSITGETTFQNRRIKPTQLVVNDFGELFVYVEDSRAILKFDENGSYLDSYELPDMEPTDIEIMRDRLLITDQFSNQIAMMTQNGLLGDLFPVVEERSGLIDEVTVGNKKFS